MKPKPVITIKLDQLTLAIHRVRHEHGDKWEPVSGCGCDQWAEQVWEQLPIAANELADKADADAEAEFLKPI